MLSLYPHLFGNDAGDTMAETTTLPRMKRPRLLVHAARLGQSGYNRNRDLKRALMGEPRPREDLVSRLTEVEASIEEMRRAGDAAYSASRHVRVLTALMAELAVVHTAQAA